MRDMDFMKKDWPKQVYKKVGINDLILVSLFRLEILGQESSFERLFRQCFDTFPSKFSLKAYPDLPDSRKLDRTLRSLRAMKMIRGSPRESFFLTAIGKKRASQTINLFRQKKLRFQSVSKTGKHH